LRSRLQRLDLAGCGVVVISEATILYFAREFTSLVDLSLPVDFGGRGNFFESLCDARPELARLAINCESWADDECVRVVCQRLRLEHLGLSGRCCISPHVVSVILESPCAQTLKEADLAYIDFMGSYETLNFVLGCPNLANLAWEVPDEEPLCVDFSRIGAARMDLGSDSEEESPEERRAVALYVDSDSDDSDAEDDVDTENVWLIVKTLKSRGGKLSSAFSGLEDFVRRPVREIPGTNLFTGP